MATARPIAANVIDLYEVLTRHRRFLVRFIILCTVLAAVVAAFLPKWYKSTASVFPAEKADLFGGMDGISSIARSFSPARALTSLGGNPEAERYIAILKSGAVTSEIIRRFDLIKVYDISTYPMEKAAKELASNTDFSVEPEGNITITVFDRDPERAAAMANAFVELLNKTNSELMVQNARGNREFIEQRYRKNLLDLTAAEDSLKMFQERFGIVALPEQTQASIKAAADLAAQLALKEVQSNVLRRTQAADNPNVAGLQVEVEELRHKLLQMDTGSEQGFSLLVPFKKVPELGSQYIRRFRDVEIQYKILQFITPLYEQAKVEEQRQTPSVLILDRAGPAEHKAKPKISLIALLGFVLSSLVALLVVFIREGLARIKSSDPDRFSSLTSELRADWFGLRLKRGEKR